MMKAKTLMIALALALPHVAVAKTAGGDPIYQQRVQEQYCAKLREGPAAYTQFVHAKRIVHGYTYSDFASVQGEPARIDCKIVEQRMSAANVPAKDATKMAGKASDAR